MLPQSQESHQPTEAELAAEQAALIERMQVLASSIQSKLDKSVSARTAIEERWLTDLRQYYATQDDGVKTTGSIIKIGITRQKTAAAAARLVDMLFPTDDKNWGIQPTPLPELAEDLKSDDMVMLDPSTQVSKADLARATLDKAKKSSEKMTAKIEDVLIEADYNATCRMIIDDACIYGTGIIKSPIVKREKQAFWRTDGSGIYALEQSTNESLAVECVSPWDFYPEAGVTSLDNADYVIERKFLSRKQLRELIKEEGFFKDVIKELMADEDRNTGLSKTDRRDQVRSVVDSMANSSATSSDYEVFEYHGMINVSDLMACNAPVIDSDKNEQLAVVWLCHGRVIRVAPSHSERGEFPYSVFNWEKDPSSIFGFGIPRLMQSSQRIIDASFRAMMDNAAFSTGPQVIVDNSAIQPADGDWNLAPRKVWVKNKAGVPIGDAISFINVPNNNADLSAIFSFALKLTEEETGLFAVAQGNAPQGTGAHTAQGMSIMINSANIIIRRAVKYWDDQITKPVIRRLYDHFMTYSDDDTLKGDFQVDARGSSVLLAREFQANNLGQLLQLTINPVFAPMIDSRELLSKYLQSLNIAPDDVLFSEEEIVKRQQEQAQAMQQQQAQQPQAQQNNQALEVAQLKAQAELQKVQLTQQSDMAELQFKAQENTLERQHQAQLKAVDREIEMMQLAQDRDLTMVQVKADVEAATAGLQTKRDIEGTKAQVANNEMLLKAKVGSGI